MKNQLRKAIVPMLMAGCLGMTAGANAEDDAADTVQAAGVSAGMVAVDKETGKLRAPTAEERAALAAGFQKDLARLTKKQRKQPQVRTLPNGATAATVGLSRLEFLVVETNEDGSLSFSHAPIDDDGNVVAPPAPSLPEM